MAYLHIAVIHVIVKCSAMCERGRCLLLLGEQLMIRPWASHIRDCLELFEVDRKSTAGNTS